MFSIITYFGPSVDHVNTRYIRFNTVLYCRLHLRLSSHEDDQF
jgi:hypothetical protein